MEIPLEPALALHSVACQERAKDQKRSSSFVPPSTLYLVENDDLPFGGNDFNLALI